MCGIAGLFDLTGDRPADPALLDRMVAAMYLRGPDDSGTVTRAPLAMGMRRLSIIDIAGGHQPIANEDDTVHVVMNGELYSFPEMREELLAAGHTFRTHSDTEVLVHGYEQWGIDGLLERLNGMFAFALYDEKSRQLFVARDRLGIKPLVYSQVDDFFLFASTTRALLASGLVPVTPDPLGVRLYLHHQFVPAPHSIIDGVRKLPPAHYLVVENGSVSTPRRYWRMPEADATRRPAQEWAADLRALMEDAVRRHMLSDVEVGVFLSGGLDSTTVLGLMSQCSDRPVKAFSIGFEHGSGYDETDFARIAAQRFNADFHHVFFTAAHVERLARDVVQHLDEPLGDPACLPTFLLAQDARASVKVVLSGEGADELFAGYDYYKRLLSKRTRVRKALGLERLRRGVDERRGVEGLLAASLKYRSPRSGFPYAMHPGLVEAVLDDGDDNNWAHVVDDLESAAASGSMLDTALRADATVWLPDDLLMKVDWMTMAHSLEARVPFLDYRVVEMAMRMPDNLKLDARVEKKIMRTAFADLMGPEITARDKHGFSLPLQDWFNGELAALVDGTLGGDGLQALPWLQRDTVAAIVKAHRQGRGNFARQLWSLYVLVGWFEGVTQAARAA